MFTNIYFLASFGLVLLAVLTIFTALFLRRVVPTNEVHIVQSSKKTTSYGKDLGNGNTYYEWPTWVPLIGVTKVKMPTSVFNLNIKDYEAYDQGRLPFVVDVMAFFRIDDSNVAAQRVASFQELDAQLQAIVKGAIRTVLASNEIETILQGRSAFGEAFTKEVGEQLKNWGVCAVKNIELMDIRDHQSSQVIQNIMAKKKSHIEMQSRTEVAQNMKLAQTAEIEAKREVDLSQQQAQQTVGLRMVDTQREVELSKQSSLQAVKEQERMTKEKEMNVLRVEHVKTAEINRDMSVVKADQERQVAILTAEGQLEAKRRESEGITLQGEAKASAERAMQLAPVQAQITLAKEIGQNESYQKYLVTIKQVEAQQAIGVEQAKALDNADIRVIANTGSNVSSGLKSAMDLFSANGGVQVGAMLEGFAQTEVGQDLIEKVVSPKKKSNGSSGLNA